MKSSVATIATATPPVLVMVTVPVRTVSETNMREHWAKRHRRRAEQRGTTKLMLRAQNWLPPSHLYAELTVRLTRIAPCQLDSDNLQGALKACRDGVADALGVDDSDKRIRWVYAQRKGTKPREYGVEIMIS